jgi:hypothetical protein
VALGDLEGGKKTIELSNVRTGKNFVVQIPVMMPVAKFFSWADVLLGISPKRVRLESLGYKIYPSDVDWGPLFMATGKPLISGTRLIFSTIYKDFAKICLIIDLTDESRTVVMALIKNVTAFSEHL